MNIIHDPDLNFYYYGDEVPTKGWYQKHLGTPTLIAVDTETISLKERIAIGIGVAVSSTKAFYFPTFPSQCSIVPWHLLKNPAVTKIMHNALFDLDALREYEVDNTNVRDTSVMSRLLCNRFNDLANLAVYHLMEVYDAGDFLREHNAKTMMECPVGDVAKKCMQDAMATYKLFQLFSPQVDLTYLMDEMATIPIMMTMSWRGILIDQDERAMIEDALQIEVDIYRQQCEEMGFNPGSSEQVAYMLAKRGAYRVFTKLPFTRGRGKRRLSADKEILGVMDDPLARLVLTYRERQYLLSHYILPWAHEERATTRFHLAATTGRPSSTDRNMQNIPGKFRKDGSEYEFNCRGVLLPDSGVWTDVDFSQVEPRCLAYLSGDKEMEYIFSLPRYNDDGTRNIEADIHGQAALAMDMDRKFAKQFNLAMTYGATDLGLMETFGIRDKSRVQRWRELWNRKFPQAADWIEANQEMGLRQGYVTTALGRKLRLPTLDEESEDGIKRKAIDYPCQGSAAEALKRGLVACHDLDMALQVHDELLCDGYVEAKRFEVLESVMPFRTPVDVKYLKRWE